jgi:cytochrome c
MSRFPNYVFPLVGGLGIVFGLAYGIPTRQYKAELAEVAQLQAEAAQASAAEAASANAELQAKIAEVQERAAELEARPVAASLTAPAPVAEGGFGLGRAAHPEEIAAWDVDVLPDGRGLPEGSGNAFDGEEIYAEKCAACHGDFAEGVDNWPVLAGGFDTLADEDPVKTVGSYWPHLSTVWDYVHRSMPFGEAGTLTADETYAIVAYILYSNDLIEDDFELSHENLGSFEMYNRDGFVVDDRPELEYSQWRAEPCMENCKEEAAVTMRTVFLVETPPEGGSDSVMNHNREVPLPPFTAAGAAFVPDAPVQPVKAAAPVEEAAADDGQALIEAGRKGFRKCAACHKVGDGAAHASGPHLNGILGRTMGAVEGFAFSPVFQAAAAEGRVWDAESLSAFLAKPKEYMKGTKMSFAGLRKEDDVKAMIAFLGSLSE